MTKSVDELVASLPEAQHGQGCWGKRLNDDAAAFVKAVQEREKTGVTILRQAVLDTLSETFGVKIGQDALARHLKARCQCPQ